MLMLSLGAADASPVLADSPTIVGGNDAEPGVWPAAVAISAAGSTDARSDHICGGTLIDEEWVLTAAHCVMDYQVTDITIVAGRHDLLDSDGQELAATRIIYHSDYETAAPQHDIALIKLTKSVAYTPTLLAKPENSIALDNGEVTVVGWGSRGNGEFSTTLQQVTVPVVANDVCNQRKSYGGRVADNMICAGSQDGGKDACYGDSGGPLFLETDDGWEQVGIVSWGQGCALPYKYGVYTRVSSYTDWIELCRSDLLDPSCEVIADAAESDTNIRLSGTQNQKIYLPMVLNR